MTIPSITPLPAAPDPAADTPSVFSNKAAAFVLAQKAMSVELGATIPAMNSAVSQVNADASTASSAAGTATDKATEAAAFAASAANAPGTNATSATSVAIPTSLPATFSLTVQTGKSFLNQYLRATATASPENYVEGDIASYNSATGALVLNVRQSQGVGTYAAWSVSLAAPRLVTVSNSIVQKTAAFTAVAADIGRMFECSGSWSLALDAAATLGDGWYAYVRAVNGVITVDPNGAELIDGASTLLLTPGETVQIACSGSSFSIIRSRSLGILKVSDQKVSGTQGGAAVGNDATQTRTLNTVEINTISGASLAANVITLPAGTYDVHARAPASQINGHKLSLYNVTDGAIALHGASASTSATSAYTTDATLIGRITITATKTFTLRHFTQSAIAGYGLGQPANSGQVEVYAEAIFRKVA